MSANTSAAKTSDADKYIVFGIDFTDFLGTGTDLSGIIDTIGGALNFEIFSILSCLLSIFSIFILIFVVTSGESKGKSKGLEIPGVGTLSPQQPLVIQMPIMSKPYPFNDSPFPRDT